MELGCRNRLRHGARSGEHGRAHPRARRPSRPSHTHRAHRRRLARRRGSVHGAGARAAARAVCGQRIGIWHHHRARRDRSESRRAGRLHGRRRDTRDSVRARPCRRHRVARALYADRADPGAGYRGRLCRCLRRLDGARRVSRRTRRRPIRLQPSGRVRSAAHARRVCRALLRRGWHAAVAALSARGSGPDSGERSPS